LNLRAKWEDEAFRNRAGAKKSLELKKKWQNQEYAEHMTEVTRKTSRRIWADPAHRERMTKISKARWEDKAYRERMREQSKKNWQSEKYKAFMAESYRKKWRSDPDFRNKFLPILAENGKKSHYYRFLRVCEKALHENFWLSDDTYETARENYGSRNGEGIVRFDKAINKYFNGEMSKFFEVFCERIRTAQQGNATLNHKVVKAEKLSEREDVYDLTIDGTHNFALGSGVFVHNSVDGDSAAAMRYCVSGDTRVVTADGLLQIEKIPHNSPINTDVLSMNNKINRATEWFDSGEHETRTIETFRGLSLTGSLNHPLLTWQKGEGGKPQFKWKLLKEIVEGDFAVISRSPLLFPAEEPALEAFFPMRKHRRQEHLLPRRMTPELAFLLGAIVAEGNIGEKQIGFCNNDQEFIEQFKAGFKKVFPDCRLHEFVRRPQGFTRKPYTSLEIHSLQVIEFLNNLGLVRGRAKTRQVPEIIFASTKNSMAAFLRGYAEGGGSVYKSTDLSLLEITFISVSKKLMQEMQLLLLRFGIDSSSRWQRTRNTFKLFIRGQVNLNLFMEQINFATQRKKEKLQEIAARNASAWVMSKMDFVPFLADYLRQRTCYRGQSGWLTKHNLDRYPKIDKHWGKLLQILAPEDRQLYQALKANKYIFDKIVLVKAGPKQKVFSIKVASPCHSFVSNGFISHNTEARLGKIAVEMLSDIEKDTVDFGPNFDESLQEPLVLPSRVPNLLINGSSGIAVGMATNIPPHNLSEVADGVNALIENPEMSVADLMKHIKGPDFPTGALICGKAGIKSALETGRGSIVLRAKTQIEETRGGKQAIIVTEIPYQVNKADLIETIANLVKDKKIKGISDLRDESDRSGMRIFIETRRDANVNIVLNQLFKHTNLQISFGVNMVALVDGVPVQLNLKQALQEYIKHRQKVVTRRAKFELKKAEELAHILEGLLIAVSNIDKIVALIRKSKDPAEAKAGLMKSFKLSEIQAQAILDLKLQRLTQLERHKIDEEYKATKARIKELKELLASEKKILGVVAKETAEVKEKYGDERKSKIIAEVGEVSEEELIQDVEVAVLLTRDGYIKRMPLSAFKAQLRGGRGVAGMATREEDEIDKIFVATTLSYLLFFTNKGKVYKIKAYELPEASRAGKGQSIANVLELGMGEVVTAAISAKNFDTKTFLFMATRNGVVKKTDMEAFANIRRTGIAAIKLKGEDELRWVKETDGKQEIVMGTKTGLMIRFSEKLVRPMGRAAAGVKGISLRKGDNVVSMDIVEKDADLLAVSASGFGKRMKVEEFSAQNRGGKGHIAIKLRKDDEVAKMMLIHKDDELLFVSSKGTMMRQKASGISTQGRYAKGVRLQRLDEGDYLVDLARVVKAEEEMGEQGAGKE
jgi:DNA gyrase subunit A